MTGEVLIDTSVVVYGHGDPDRIRQSRATDVLERLSSSSRGRLSTQSASTYKLPSLGECPPDLRVTLLARAPQPLAPPDRHPLKRRTSHALRF